MVRTVKGWGRDWAAGRSFIQWRRGAAAEQKFSLGNFQRRVYYVVTALAEDGKPNLHRVAFCVGTSAPTLQRRLRRVGLTYAGVVEQVRRQMAEQMLAKLGDTIGDVARALGYSDPAHFSRAFRRWTGLTPRDFRRNPQAHADPQSRRRRERAARRASARAVEN